MSEQSFEQNRSEKLASFVAGARGRVLPEAVRDAGRQALADFIAVSVAGHQDGAVEALRAVAANWNAPGGARIFLGSKTQPAIAALLNGTMTHAMDLDDVHYAGGGHPSGPCWSAALSLAEHHEVDDETALRAFVTGYEVMARLGGGGQQGVGRTLQHHGFHPTSIFGRAGAAASASVLLDLDQDQVANALGVAATTAGGLVGSFGTHSKPFHAGKAAMDGVMAAEMARSGFVSGQNLFERDKGLLPSFLKGAEFVLPELDFDEQWYVLRNGYKRFASCRATHAAAEAALSVKDQVGNRTVTRIQAFVNPIALVAAGNPAPRTGLEARFSTYCCIAMGLAGYRLSAFDFTDEMVADPAVSELLPKIECIPVKGQSEVAAKLLIDLSDGQQMEASVDIVLGHPDRPLNWAQIQDKFEGLVAPVLGDERADELFKAVTGFATNDRLSIPRISALLEARQH
ncbi:MmgE/PrpD family protein [Bosea sp. SSUT16]|jgi:2-methylcitrate dehydratase PrpD|uniref:MmgE/PrpD family protein n=1 Tax=Bosea spartocytisi TaxID=2773451 RepID=A0A927I084_9HYPH|nr:MmgE/PrpD family protein [Bosea spartocytisi]MBD3846266.1 MmgE/PrpD family protein [Bosea spartocytisi]MCT4473450.1 MmgE/PrpD family protein [Bosea spartocytisi]